MSHTETELAYRRGVFHGLHALLEFCESRANTMGQEVALAEAVTQARAMRTDGGSHERYTHELFRRVREMMEDHDRTYYGGTIQETTT